jgi:hypothetical protein
MSDLKMDETNEGHSGTEIQAQTDFNQDYVFQGNGQTAGPAKNIDGLRGIAAGLGTGVRGEGFVGAAGRAINTGVNGGAIPGSPPPFAGVSGTGVFYGVLGSGGLYGVHGQNGFLAGVRGQASSVSAEGVQGESDDGTGVHGKSKSAQGVFGESRYREGVYGQSDNREGVHGQSVNDRGGVFESSLVAQLQLNPVPIETPAQLTGTAKPGDLLATIYPNERGTNVASLWFCIIGGPPSAAGWVKIA